MTTDPRVEAAAREMHRLEYGGAIDWDADGSLHSAFYLAAESILAAADAARVVPADVAGLVERLTETEPLEWVEHMAVAGGYPYNRDGREAAAALTALAERAETAERELEEAGYRYGTTLATFESRAKGAESLLLRVMLEYTAALDPLQGWDDEREHPAVKQARAALAKATGQPKETTDG